MTGKDETTAVIYVSISSSSSLELMSLFSLSAQDNASAVYNSFPGTCEIVKLCQPSLKWKRRIRGGKLSRSLLLSSGISGLWSVSTDKNRPNRCLENCSQAHVTASVFFSIWAYLFFMSESALQANATGFQRLSAGEPNRGHMTMHWLTP